MSNRDDWKQDAACIGWDTQIFFEKYEEDENLRPAIDEFCSECPVRKMCFAVGISSKETGVWGGVYLDRGKISREFNRHRTKEDWAVTWESLTIDKDY